MTLVLDVIRIHGKKRGRPEVAEICDGKPGGGGFQFLATNGEHFCSLSSARFSSGSGKSVFSPRRVASRALSRGPEVRAGRGHARRADRTCLENGDRRVAPVLDGKGSFSVIEFELSGDLRVKRRSFVNCWCWLLLEIRYGGGVMEAILGRVLVVHFERQCVRSFKNGTCCIGYLR